MSLSQKLMMAAAGAGPSGYFTPDPAAWWDFDNTTGDDTNDVLDRSGNGRDFSRWDTTPFNYSAAGMDGHIFSSSMETFLGSKTFTGMTLMFVTGSRVSGEILMPNAMDGVSADTRFGFSSGTQFYSALFRSSRYDFFPLSTSNVETLHVLRGGQPISATHYQYNYWQASGLTASSDVGGFDGTLIGTGGFRFDTQGWRFKHMSVWEEALTDTEVDAWWADRATHNFNYADST